MAGEVSLDQVLMSPVVTRVISTIKTPQSLLTSYFGARPGGPNSNPVGGHHTGWDIFDRTRTIAHGRAPGTGPGTITPQVVGHVTAQIYRAHEKMMLLDEKLHRKRALGANWGTIDSRGQRYITAQEGYMAQRFLNSREFMLSRMLRGGFDLLQSGDDWIAVDIGSGTFTIDYQVPSGNKSKLNMLGAGDIIGTSWDDAAADVIGDCFAINKAFEQLHGRPLRHVWVNSTVMGYLLVNTGLKNAAGTANVTFSEFAPRNFTGPDGVQDTGFEVIFRGLPWLRFHVYDAGLDVNGTYTQFFDDTHATFLPDIDATWFEMHEGSEIVRENVLDPGTERYGLSAWVEPHTQPAGFEMISVDNCLPVLYVPKCVAYGTVVY